MDSYSYTISTDLKTAYHVIPIFASEDDLPDLIPQPTTTFCDYFKQFCTLLFRCVTVNFTS